MPIKSRTIVRLMWSQKKWKIKLTFIAALEHSGTPSLYLPVIKPQASGDQVIAPTPDRARKV